MDDRSAAARAGGQVVQVDRDLVRSGPPRLELETAGGRILVAERTVFKDRGAGNVMWVGRFPEEAWDSVVLTVQDGYLQGRFGEPGRPAWWLRSGLDGRGVLEQRAGPAPAASADLCAGGIVPAGTGPASAAVASRVDLPPDVRSASNHDRLDVLVLYTVGAAEVWDELGYGTPRASVQAAMDFLALVFRNGAMPATPRLVHLAEAPAYLDGPRDLPGRLASTREVVRLQLEHRADVVHLFTGEASRTLGYCGIAYLLTRETERDGFDWPYGVTSATCAYPAQEGRHPYFGQVFAHEVGHNLGANHDAANTDMTRDRAFRPWAFGHFDISTSPTVETIMSYRSYAPRQWVPFFSSVRIRPNGWTIGTEGERENERALHDSVPLAVRYSDRIRDPSGLAEFPPQAPPPEAPTGLTVRVTSRTGARLEWNDESDDEAGFRVHARTGSGIWRTVATAAADQESIEVSGLKREGRYSFRVRAWHDRGAADSETRTVTLRVTDDPDPPPGGIDVPADVTAAAVGSTSVALTWTGPARGTVEIEARSWQADWTQVMTANAAAGRATVANLDAEAPYTFRLRNRSGDGRVTAWSDEVSATTGDAFGPCRTGGQYLCLSDGRFEIQAHWKDHNRDGVFGRAGAVPIDVSDESGMFWFFSSTNIELVVKTLDGRAINDHYWVFFGALSDVEYWVTVRDTEGGGRRTYHNPPAENCGQSDTTAFVPAGVSSRSALDSEPESGFDLVPVSVAPFDIQKVGPRQEAAGTCEAGPGRLCLHDGRFAVEVSLLDPNTMERRKGEVVSSVGTKETGFFWFFSPSNIELAAKVLDGRALNGKYWFLYGGLSDVEYAITLTETATGQSRIYRNEAGSLCGGIDVNALP